MFSRPADNVAEKANSFMQQPNRQLPGGTGPQAPIFARKPRADFDVLPGAQPPRQYSPEEVRRMREKADREKNWMLMSEAEILNVPTAEKILGLPDPDQGLTVTERYFKRQENDRNFKATNGVARLRNVWAADSTTDEFGQPSREKKEAVSGMNPQEVNAKSGKSRLEIEQETRRAASPWGSAFDVPVVQAKPDVEQQASMARFRALLDSAPVTDKPEVTTPGQQPAMVASRQQIFSTSEKPVEKPVVKPVGDSYSPVRDTSFRPITVTPISSPLSPQANPVKVQPAKPLTEPPPWVKDDKKPAAPSTDPMQFQKRKI